MGDEPLKSTDINEGKILSEEVVPTASTAVLASALPQSPTSTSPQPPPDLQQNVRVAPQMPQPHVEQPVIPHQVLRSPIDNVYAPRASASQPAPIDHVDEPSQARFAPLPQSAPAAAPGIQTQEHHHSAWIMPEHAIFSHAPLVNADQLKTLAPITSPAPAIPVSITPATQYHDVFAAPHTRKTGLFIGGLVAMLVILGGAAALASYRYAPQFFYTVVPSNISQALNVVWPLHSSPAEMLPVGTMMYGTAALQGDNSQTQALEKVLSRVPGLNVSKDSIAQGLDAYVKTRFDISLVNDIKPIFGETAYFALPNAQNTSYIVSLPIKDFDKMAQLLNKIQSSAKTKEIITSRQTVKGVDVYISSYSGVVIEEDIKTSAAVSKILPRGLTKAVSGSVVGLCKAFVDNCTFASATPAHAQVAGAEQAMVAFMVLDNHFFVADSLTTLQEIITQAHSRAPSLASTAGFKQSTAKAGQSLGTLFINPQSFTTGQSDSALYKGLNGMYYDLAVNDNGFVMNTTTSYDESKIDPLLLKIMKTPNMTQNYAAELPASTAFFGQFGGLSDMLSFYSKQSFGLDTTGDAFAKELYGVGLSDIAAVLKSEAVIAYIPEPKSALVLKAEVTDAKAALALINKIGDFVQATYADTVRVAKESIAGNEAVVLQFNNPAMNLAGFMEPTMLVVGDQLIIASSKDAAASIVVTPATTLASDARLVEDTKKATLPARSNWFLHSKRLYNGVVQTIRDVLGDEDVAQSDQEKVVDAFLDVFPSITGASHSGQNAVSSIAIVPVVALSPERKTEIEVAIKNDPSSIFNIAPFLEPFASNRAVSDEQEAKYQDAAIKFDLEEIADNFTDYANSIDATKKASYSTSVDQKIDPSSGILKDMIVAGIAEEGVEGTYFPDYYYTYHFDGSIFRVTGLTIHPYSTGEKNCADPKKIRDRYTYCIEKKL